MPVEIAQVFNAFLQGFANMVIVVAGLAYLVDRRRAAKLRRDQLAAMQRAGPAVAVPMYQQQRRPDA